METVEITARLLETWATGAILVLAAALGALFHRGRSALAALVLLWVWAGFAVAARVPPFAGLPQPRLEAMLMLAPFDLLVISWFVETAVLSWRGALVVGLLVVQGALAVLLPADLWDAAWQLERWPARVSGDLFGNLGLPSPGLSAGVGLLAAGVAGVRWNLVRDPVLPGLVLAALVAGGVGYGMLAGMEPSLGLSLAGFGLLASVGWASYRMAFLDPLTGLPGRRLLDENMARLGRRWAVAMVDVDHFKQFNDRHGHDVGDQVLRMVAATLRRHFGRHAYRYGGEEFTVLFPGRSSAQARERCEAARADIARRTLVLRGSDRPSKPPRGAGSRGNVPGRTGARSGGRAVGKGEAKGAAKGTGKRGGKLAVAKPGLGVTVSIGIAERNARMRRPEVLIKAADVALYRAKEGGRDQVVEHG